MKAVVSAGEPGAEDVRVAELPDPVPRPGEVLIRVGYCGVNYPDVLLLQDRYQLRPSRPFVPGGEIGGEVVAVADGVTGYAAGDRVMARMSLGGMAELVTVPQDRVHKIPDRMPLDEAAAIQTTYLTAYHALVQRASMRAGERLLVLGAAGGVGLAAVQLGLSALFKQMCPGGAADVIFDGVGGDYTEAALRATAPDGRLLVIGFPAGIPRIPANLVLLKRCQVVGVLYGGWAAEDPATDRANCDEVLRLYDDGQLRPHVSRRFPADQARDAIDELKYRRAVGKVVVAL